MKEVIFLLLFFSVIGCCIKEEPPPINKSELPESKFFLSSEGETLYDFSYKACNRTPSASETLGSDSILILFSPGIFLPQDLANIPDDLDFSFIFHDVEVKYNGDPTLDEFWLYLQQNKHVFNAPPFERDFFLKIIKGGKVYQNWWNGNLVNIPVDISRDETGLEFIDYEFSRFDEFGEICLHNYGVLRLIGVINGILVTKDYSDTINVSGNLDVFLNLRK